MRYFQVLDVDFESLAEERYDVALFASGFESRCIHLPGVIDPSIVSHPLVFGFTEESHSGKRDENNKFFLKRWNSDPIQLSSDDEKPIYEYLHKYLQHIDGSIRILLDYSSMSRLWYAAVLNWARVAVSGRDVTIDFVYSRGRYEEPKYPMVIREMVSIPGCEGRAYRQRESVAVFGLGFHGLAALCVLDHLEADTVYAFLASAESSDNYFNYTQNVNKELIRNHKTKAVLDIPLSSLESCYRYLADTIAPHRPDGEITLIPMGPKPHVLASILVAMRFQEVACLRVSGKIYPQDVVPTGEIIATRVIVKGECLP